MADLDKRVRYFDGQLLNEKDFNLAQDYLIERSRRHARLLHSPGITEGLTVDAAVGASEAKVAPGSAVDDQGQQIVLVESRVLPLGAALANKTVLVVITYAELESDPATAGGQGSTRWQERPKVEVFDATSAPSETASPRLARLVLDANGKVTQNDASVRRIAGARLGSELELRRLTLSRDSVASSGWPALTCGAAGRMDLAGDLQVGGALSVGPGKIAADGEFNLRFTADTSDSARIFSRTAGAATSLNLEVGDDNNDAINIATLGWQAGQRGPINLKAGNITLEVEAVATRAVSIVDSAAKPLLLVRNDGNVGIGTTAPADKLEVAGNIGLDNQQPDGARLIWWSKNSPEWRARNFSGTLGFFQGEGKPIALSLSATGVGIGTASPGATLHVSGTSILTQEAWRPVTFQNAWTNFDVNAYNSAGCMLDSQGFVHLRGLVKNGQQGTTIFTLPSGLTPEKRQLFAVQTSPNAIGRVDVLSTGEVLVVMGNSGWVSLDGLTFRAGVATGSSSGGSSSSGSTTSGSFPGGSVGSTKDPGINLGTITPGT